MAIQSLRAIQNPETRVITDFEVTFKQMRFSSTQLINTKLYDPNNFQARSATAGAPEVDNGPQTLEQDSTSFESNLE
jgi:hypothetical protein